jgi:hypothetical protein
MASEEKSVESMEAEPNTTTPSGDTTIPSSDEERKQEKKPKGRVSLASEFYDFEAARAFAANRNGSALNMRWLQRIGNNTSSHVYGLSRGLDEESFLRTFHCQRVKSFLMKHLSLALSALCLANGAPVDGYECTTYGSKGLCSIMAYTRRQELAKTFTGRLHYHDDAAYRAEVCTDKTRDRNAALVCAIVGVPAFVQAAGMVGMLQSAIEEQFVESGGVKRGELDTTAWCITTKQAKNTRVWSVRARGRAVYTMIRKALGSQTRLTALGYTIAFARQPKWAIQHDEALAPKHKVLQELNRKNKVAVRFETKEAPVHLLDLESTRDMVRKNSAGALDVVELTLGSKPNRTGEGGRSFNFMYITLRTEEEVEMLFGELSRDGETATPAELLFGHETAGLCGENLTLRRFSSDNDEHRNGEAGSIHSLVSNGWDGPLNEQDLSNFCDELVLGADLIDVPKEAQHDLEAVLERSTTEERPMAVMPLLQQTTSIDVRTATREQLVENTLTMMQQMQQMQLRLETVEKQQQRPPPPTKNWEDKSRMEIVGEPPAQEPILTTVTPGPTALPLKIDGPPPPSLTHTPAPKRAPATPPPAPSPQRKKPTTTQSQPNTSNSKPAPASGSGSAPAPTTEPG